MSGVWCWSPPLRPGLVVRFPQQRGTVTARIAIQSARYTSIRFERSLSHGWALQLSRVSLGVPRRLHAEILLLRVGIPM